MTQVYEGMPLPLTAQQVLKDLSLPEWQLEEVQALLERSLAVAKPKVLLRRIRVHGQEQTALMLEDRRIESRLIAKNLAEVSEAFVYVGTCGAELDALLAGLTDPLDQICQAQINQRLMQMAVMAARKDVMEQNGINLLNAVNPGSNADWPLSAQRDLFALLGDVQGEIGVVLTDSCLMLPVKSVSGVWYASEKEYTNCMVCPRQVCENRRAEFDQQLFDEIFVGDPHGAPCAEAHA